VEEKGKRWKDASLSKKKKSPTRAYPKGNMNKSNIQTPCPKENIK